MPKNNSKIFLKGLWDWPLLLFALLTVLFFIEVNDITFRQISIFEHTNAPYNEKYFSNCNPCPLTFKVHSEKKLYDEVNVIFTTSFIGSTGYDNHVYNVNEFGSDCSQPCGPCFKTNTQLCQGKGWDGGGCTPGGQHTAGCDPAVCDIACYKSRSVTSDWIELRYKGDTILRFDRNDMINTKTVNIWDAINDSCGGKIRGCISESNCDYECNVDFEWYSQNAGGSWNYVGIDSLVPHTTSTTTTTTIGDLPREETEYCLPSSPTGPEDYASLGVCNMEKIGTYALTSFDAVFRCEYHPEYAGDQLRWVKYHECLYGSMWSWAMYYEGCVWCTTTKHSFNYNDPAIPTACTSETCFVPGTNVAYRPLVPTTTTTSTTTTVPSDTTTTTMQDTTTTIASDKPVCPHICCSDHPNYQDKDCSSGYKCISNICKKDENGGNGDIDDWFEENKEWAIPVGLIVAVLFMI